MSLSLDQIRADIDALDADLRALLLARADLVAQVAEAKAANGTDLSPLRPMREMQQMLALLDWQKNKAPALSPNGVIAIWREIIGMALAQQGGIDIFASAMAMPAARAHFGASLEYRLSDDALAACAAKPRALAVLSLAEASPPPEGMTVLARLPVLGAAAALLYGARNGDEADDSALALVCRQQALAGDTILGETADGILVETETPEGDTIWGRYLTLGGRS